MASDDIVQLKASASAVADYEWEAEDEDELSFPRGAMIVDIVIILIAHGYHRRVSNQLVSQFPAGEVGGLEPMRVGLGFFPHLVFTTCPRHVSNVRVYSPINPCLINWCQKMGLITG